MLITKNVHISSEAIRYHFAGAFCRRSFSLCKSANSFIAFSPIGVAAQPNPKILAIILAAIYSFALCPFGIAGNKKCNTGYSPFVIRSISPDSFAISITPVHIAIMPSIVIDIVTASFAPSIEALLTASAFPVTIP